ncbi:uncharacterized protein OCT59_026966 [Rhizophagus irregularis]|nr:hypothetical protein OCT59_026966 [Rhizophagus irregularis]
MELVKLNDENSFDPTPKLKSSPVSISFVSFNENDKNCIHCGEEYTETIIRYQKYCKKCLSCYLTNITDNNIYLDVYLFAKDLECNEHEISRTKVPRNIQECCRNCLIILCFKQIIWFSYPNYPDLRILYENVIESERYCKLCGKLLYQGTEHDFINNFILCSNCYLISIGYIESTLTEKLISIIYLPWWDDRSTCYCHERLIFTSNCQKYCENCYIFFIGCRYCLTTNIIFGIANQSQCKKCKTVSIIILDNKKIISFNCGNNVLDDFLVSIRSYQSEITKFTDVIKNIDKYFVPNKIIHDNFESNYIFPRKFMKYMPFSQFTNIKKIAVGGFSIVYQATLLDSNKTIILKRFKNTQYAEEYFLRELKSYHDSYADNEDYGNPMVIETYGFTKDPQLNGLDSYILVMEYASGGNLHEYLQKNFTRIGWQEKLDILFNIINGLQGIHNKEFIHRDFHSGNLLVNLTADYYRNCKIGDLGLSRPANDTSTDNEIYGVIPYIAPEIFKGSAFSKESDIYSLEDTPECYTNLMKSCWDSDPKRRPSISVIRDICFKLFCQLFNSTNRSFDQADLKSNTLIDSKKLGLKFSEKTHPKAIYTSRSLNSYISKCSSIFSKCSSIKFSSNDYISKELKFDIDAESNRLDSFVIKRNIEESNINSCENNGKRIKN